MRVSTAQIFDSGSRGIGRNQFDLYKLQNQLSSGRKNLTPADDPAAAAQALVLTQSKEVSAQFIKNQGDARGKLSIVESQVGAVGDLLQNVREKLVQAGNTTLSDSDRSYIAKELEARFSELLGIANGQDGTGSYLFSGYQGAVKPFSVNQSGAQYAGDDGKRLLQVDGSRQMATNVSGKELFELVPSGNGAFSTYSGDSLKVNSDPANTGVIGQVTVTNQILREKAIADSYSDVEIRFSVNAGVTQYSLYDISSGATLSAAPTDFTSGQPIVLQKTTSPVQDFGVSVVIGGTPLATDKFVMPGGGANLGTGVIDKGSINNLPAWNKALNDGYGDIEIRFSDNAGVTEYSLYDISSGAALGLATAFNPGKAIALQKSTTPAQDFGASVVVEGTPQAGDRFIIKPSVNESIFTTLRSAINTLNQGIGSSASGNSTTEFVNDLAGQLQQIDQALENVNKVRSTVGSNLQELESLENSGEDLQLQYASSLSALQDLDYAKAISEMAQKQLQLEAAQLSFKQISQLSLFSML